MTDLQQSGGNLRVSYQLDPRSGVQSGATTQYSKSDSAASTSRLSSFYVGYFYQLTRLTTAGLNYRYTTQNGEGPAAVDYVENAVIATVNIRF